MSDAAAQKHPNLEDLVREWMKGDPILRAHFLGTRGYNEGMYIETACHLGGRRWDPDNPGHAVACVPSEKLPSPGGVILYNVAQYNLNIGMYSQYERGHYVKPEDPQFLEKLKEHLISSHDRLAIQTSCRIRWRRGDPSMPFEVYNDDGTKVS